MHNTQDGWTALMSAASRDHAECVRLLLEAGADKDAMMHVRDLKCRFGGKNVLPHVFEPYLVFLFFFVLQIFWNCLFASSSLFDVFVLCIEFFVRRFCI